jgi:hypothetical protein
MERLNKDELFTLALYLDLLNLVNFCKTARKYDKLFKNATIWRGKIRRFSEIQV